jgi:trans-aconitate 2-methyltransferase
MSDSAWNPDQYERFKAERSRPFFDLLALVKPRAGMRILDLGCGTGELTREMHTRLAARETIGVDGSDTMLARSAPFAGPDADQGLRFERARIEDFAAEAGCEGGFDLVLSNAALHWVDGHPAIFARLAAFLAREGQLAVQMPANEDHPSHVVAAAVAGEAPFHEALGGYTRVSPRLAIEEYAKLLDRLGFGEMDVRMQVYAHRLASRDEVVEWVKGSLLTEYTGRLGRGLGPRFVARYREKLLPELEDERPYLYPFKRVLLWGRTG